jgi:hypothetical protein
MTKLNLSKDTKLRRVVSEFTLILATRVCRQSFDEANICTVFSAFGHLLQHSNVAVGRKKFVMNSQIQCPVHSGTTSKHETMGYLNTLCLDI